VALALEGTRYAAASGLMKRVARAAGFSKPGRFRIAGLAAPTVGVLLV
jgi:uncharacterized protein YjeT (DUF2065 family)